MKKTNITEREMTPHEFERMKKGFDENALDNGVAIQSADRYGFVATEGPTFLGCSSGLAYKNGDVYSGWFYLTDLFVEKAHRGKGIGAALLSELESRIVKLGVKDTWTWTAGYEAVGFYQKQGYSVIIEMENWYSDKSSRVALRKKLRA